VRRLRTSRHRVALSPIARLSTSGGIPLAKQCLDQVVRIGIECGGCPAETLGVEELIVPLAGRVLIDRVQAPINQGNDIHRGEPLGQVRHAQVRSSFDPRRMVLRETPDHGRAPVMAHPKRRP